MDGFDGLKWVGKDDPPCDWRGGFDGKMQPTIMVEPVSSAIKPDGAGGVGGGGGGGDLDDDEDGDKSDQANIATT